MSEYVNVPRAAIEWLKLYYPALTVKAGLCEQVAGRVYTKTSLAAPPVDAVPGEPVAPIDMVLHCPACGKQHIDAPEFYLDDRSSSPLRYDGGKVHSGCNPPQAGCRIGHHLVTCGTPGCGGCEPFKWTNPPHRSHLCHGCGHVWRPADVPTNGVAAVKTIGKADKPLATPMAQGEPSASPYLSNSLLDRHWQRGFMGLMGLYEPDTAPECKAAFEAGKAFRAAAVASRAVVAEPQPVAWRWRYDSAKRWVLTETPMSPGDEYEVQPLYAIAPAAAAEPSQVELTDSRIDAICAPGRAARWKGDGRQYDRDTVRLVLSAFPDRAGVASLVASDHPFRVALQNIASNKPRFEAASKLDGSGERFRCAHCGYAWQPDSKPFHALDCAYMDAVNALATDRASAGEAQS